MATSSELDRDPVSEPIEVVSCRSPAWHSQPAVLHRLVRAQARKTPDALAAVYQNEWISYRELMRRSGNWAQHLRRQGVELGTVVGVHLERSLDLPVMVLAILEAGGVCVPLEPSDPTERIAVMIRETEPLLIVTQRRLEAHLPPNAPRLVRVDEAVPDEAEPLATSVTPESLAFVHLTSGSSGTPKGVMVSHATVAARMFRAGDDLSAAGSCLAILKTPISNSPFLGEMFAPLLHGCYFVIARPDGHQDIPYLGGLVIDHGVTHISLPSAVLRAFLEWPGAVRCRSLKAVYCGGEAVSDEVRRRFAECFGAARLVVTYGTTEAGHALSCQCAPDERLEGTRIGRPIPNARAYLLDADFEPAVAGEAGEIYLGGPRLATGYLKRSAWTAERFVPDPISGIAGARLYRSGDLGRLRPDGELDFKGRADQQVKIRGHRVELLEIESALAGCPGIQEAAAFARKNRRGEAQLVAYVVPRQKPGPTAEEIKAHLKERLPLFMVPHVFVMLDEIPLTQSGKLDRQAISTIAPSDSPQKAKQYVAPESPIERIVAEIWQNTLGIERVGLQDNFFELGGDSILATGMSIDIERRLHRRIPLSVVYGAPNLALLAESIAKEQALEPAVVIVPVQTRGGRPPLLLMPTMTGAPSLSRSLMARWDVRRPVFALGLAGEHAPWGEKATLPEIAGYCVAALREAKIDGPLHILGHCFGAILAYEIARQLNEAGIKVGRVAILDTWMKNVPGRSRAGTLRLIPLFFANLPRWIYHFVFERSRSQQVSAIRGRIRAWTRRITGLFSRRPTVKGIDWSTYKRVMPEPLRKRSETFFHALETYVPGPYSGQIVLLRAKTRPLFRGLSPDLNWGRLVGGRVRVINIPGDHKTMHEEPNGGVLAAELQAALETEAD